MRKTFAITLIAVMLAAVATLPVAAKGGKGHGKGQGQGKGNGQNRGGGAPLHVFGLITEIGAGDDEAGEPGSVTLLVLKAGGSGKKSLPEPEEGEDLTVTVLLGAGTRFGGPHGLGRSADDYRPGDAVKVDARRQGDDLVARKLRLMLLAFEGTIEAFDGEAGALSLAVEDANPAGDAWLAEHGDPETVEGLVTESTKMEGDPAEGAEAEIQARPSEDGSTLELVSLEAEEAEEEGGEAEDA